MTTDEELNRRIDELHGPGAAAALDAAIASGEIPTSDHPSNNRRVVSDIGETVAYEYTAETLPHRVRTMRDFNYMEWLNRKGAEGWQLVERWHVGGNKFGAYTDLAHLFMRPDSGR